MCEMGNREMAPVLQTWVTRRKCKLSLIDLRLNKSGKKENGVLRVVLNN